MICWLVFIRQNVNEIVIYSVPILAASSKSHCHIVIAGPDRW